jgi:hypothetical protein
MCTVGGDKTTLTIAINWQCSEYLGYMALIYFSASAWRRVRRTPHQNHRNRPDQQIEDRQTDD